MISRLILSSRHMPPVPSGPIRIERRAPRSVLDDRSDLQLGRWSSNVRPAVSPLDAVDEEDAAAVDLIFLPLQAKMLALTPISPFRPRRWSGAILPDDTAVCFQILEAQYRPVSAVADQAEVREVSRVEVTLDRERSLTLLFDPEHALDERIAMEQFAT